MVASDFLLRMWLMDECQFQVVSVTIGTTFVQCLPADPMRAMILFGANTGTSIYWTFSDQLPTYAQAPIAYATGQQPLVLTFDQIGLPMRLPVWGKSSVASTNVVLLYSSFDPVRYQKAMRMIDGLLS